MRRGEKQFLKKLIKLAKENYLKYKQKLIVYTSKNCIKYFILSIYLFFLLY